MVVATLAASLLSFVIGTLLALFLPFPLRPIYDTSLHLACPGASQAGIICGCVVHFPATTQRYGCWSLSAFLVWRWVSVLAILQCVLPILPAARLPRPSLPTDVIAGAATGAISVLLLTWGSWNIFPRCDISSRSSFWLELATMFDEPRFLAMLSIKAL